MEIFSDTMRPGHTVQVFLQQCTQQLRTTKKKSAQCVPSPLHYKGPGLYTTLKPYAIFVHTETKAETVERLKKIACFYVINV